MRLYTAQFNGVSVTAIQDLFNILAGTNNPFKIYEFGLSQRTKVGDANETDVEILLKSGATSNGTGGTTPTPVPLDVDDAAAAAVVRANDATTQASGGTIVTHFAWNWNVRMPFEKIFVPEYRPTFKGGRRAVIALNTAITMTLNGYVVFSEGD